MGLFDFFKSSKKKEQEKHTKNEAELRNSAIEIRSKLIASGIPVKNIDIEIDGDQVKVYGQTSSLEHKQQLILLLGGMDGVDNIDDRISIVIQEEEAPKIETYIVQKGDSLSKIAKMYYGDPMKYKEIFEANTDILKDPNLIYPGQELKIPQ